MRTAVHVRICNAALSVTLVAKSGVFAHCGSVLCCAFERLSRPRSWKCDRSPVATRPSAGYGSFLVTVWAVMRSLGHDPRQSVGGFTCENALSGLCLRVEL